MRHCWAAGQDLGYQDTVLLLLGSVAPRMAAISERVAKGNSGRILFIFINQQWARQTMLQQIDGYLLGAQARAHTMVCL